MAESQTLELRISDNAASTAKALGELTAALEKIKSAANSAAKLNSFAAGVKKVMEATRTRIPDKNISALERYAAAIERVANALTALGNAPSPGGKLRANPSGGSGGGSLSGGLKNLIGGLGGLFGGGRRGGGGRSGGFGGRTPRRSGMGSAGGEIQEQVSLLDALIGSLGDAGQAFNTFRMYAQRAMAAIHSGSSSLKDFMSGMMRIAKFRIFRTIIKEVGEAFRTGFENYREWSNFVGNEYSAQMYKLDNSLLQMKNSVGAAFAPLIQAAIPALRAFVSEIIRTMNYVNQFFALVTGQRTWTRAIDVHTELEAIEEQTEEDGNAARQATKNIKNLLAAWDELNIIQSESGGGGSGRTVADEQEEQEEAFTEMFEETFLFDQKVRDLVTWLEEHLPLVNAAIAGIVASLLGFTGQMVLTIMGVTLGFGAMVDYYANGAKWPTIWEAIVGILMASLGTGLLTFAVSQNMSLALITAAVTAAVMLEFGSVGLAWHAGSSIDAEAGLSWQQFWDTLISTLMGAGAGALIGWKFLGGGGLNGAIIGAEVGAAISLGIVSLVAGGKGAFDFFESSFSVTYFVESLASVLTGAAAGALLGFAFLGGGVQGALLGVTLGASVSLAIVGLGASVKAAMDLGVNQNFDVNSFLEQLTGVLTLGAAGAGIAFFMTHSIQGALIGLALGAAVSLAITGVFADVDAAGKMATEGISWDTFTKSLVSTLELAGAGAGVGFVLGGAKGAMIGAILAASVSFAITGVTAVAASGYSFAREGFDWNTFLTDAAGILQTAGAAFGITFVATGDVGKAAIMAGITAGAALVLNAVTFEFGQGMDARANGFSLDNFTESLGGAAVLMLGGAAVGAYLTKSPQGALIGLAVGAGISLAAFITGFAMGEKPDNRLHLTEDEVMQYVDKNMLDINLPVRIALMANKVTISQDARDRLEEQAEETIGTLGVIRMGLDEQESYEELRKQVFGELQGDQIDPNSLMGRIQEFAESQRTLLKTHFSLMPLFDGAETNISSEFLTSGIEGWNLVETQVQSLGQQLGEELAKGFTEDGLANFDKDLVNALTTKLAKVGQAMANARTQTDAYGRLSEGLGALSTASLEDIMSLYSQYSQDLYKGYKDSYLETASSYLAMADALQALDPVGNADVIAKYRAMYATMMDPEVMSHNIELAMEDALGRGKAMLAPYYQQMMADAGMSYNIEENTAENWKKVFEQYIGVGDAVTAEAIISFFDMLGMTAAFGTGEEFFNNFVATYGNDKFASLIITEKMRSVMAQTITEMYGESVANEFLDWFNTHDIGKYINTDKITNGLQGVAEAALDISEASEKAAQEAAEKAEREIKSDQNFEFYKELAAYPAVAFDNRPLIHGAENGEDLYQTLYSFVVSSLDETVHGGFTPILQNGEILSDETANRIAAEVMEAVSEYYAANGVLPGYNNSTFWSPFNYTTSTGYQFNAKDIVAALFSGQFFTGEGAGTYMQDVRNEHERELEAALAGGVLANKVFEATGVTVEAVRDMLNTADLNAPAVTTEAYENSLKLMQTATEGAINSIKSTFRSLDGMGFVFNYGLTPGGLSGKFKVPMMAAEGGVFDTGELFIAREAGPELVGSIGHKSGVANNEQIVEGVASGVAAGQAEQNGLLREQNNLLTKLLNKKFVAEATPSAAWGRMNERSGALWDRMKG